MNEENRSSNRRIGQRYDAQLPLNIGSGELQLKSTTKNISCSGVYCEVDRFIPVMTKLEVVMSFPIIENNKKIEKNFITNVVVVRVDPEQEQLGCDIYHLGLFFLNIKKEHSNLIARYIQQTFLASSN